MEVVVFSILKNYELYKLLEKDLSNNKFFRTKFSNKKNTIPKVIYKSGKEEKNNLSVEIKNLFNKTKKFFPYFM